MKVKLIFAWYDFWIGFYLDRDNRTLYFLPFPTIGFKIKFYKKPPYDVDDPNQPWNFRK